MSLSKTSPFTLLKESVNPIIEQFLENNPISSSPLISILDLQPIKGIEVSEAGTLELYMFKSSPCVVIGDRYAYKTGVRDLEQGKIKFKKFTLQIKITEDEIERIKQKGLTSLIARNLRNEIKNSVGFLQTKIHKWIIDPWEGVTTDPNYDSSYVGLFAPSAAGTLSDPNDLNESAGTPKDLGTLINLTGSAQTQNNIERLTSAVFIGMTKIDKINEAELPIGQIYMGCHPYVEKVLKAVHDILNSTSGQRSERPYKELLADRGIIIVPSVSFDSDYVYTTTTTTRLCFFADPKNNFAFLLVTPAEGESWTDWKEEHNTDGELMTISYEKHKKLEIGCLSQAYWVMNTATQGYMYSAKWFATVTPYEDSA